MHGIAIVFYSVGDKREACVVFVVKSLTAKCVIALQPILPQHAILTIYSTIKIHMLSVYAPTEASSHNARSTNANIKDAHGKWETKHNSHMEEIGIILAVSVITVYKTGVQTCGLGATCGARHPYLRPVY